MTTFVSKRKANPSQAEAIAFGDGPCMVLAGPGSGKTFVLTQRIRALIEDHGKDPASILVITFTKAAAKEMQSRFIRLTAGRYPEVTFGTFHSVYFRMLRMTLRDYPNRLVTNAERYRLMRGVLLRTGADTSQENIERMLLQLSLEKNLGQAADRSLIPAGTDFDRIASWYNETVRRMGRTDFDDMAPDCLAMLREDESALSMWRERFTHILIDEFQDINRVQYEAVKLLASPRNNLFVVGDDDQAIYGFRGSDPLFMRKLPKEFPGTRVLELTVNYRSVPQVIKASASVIAMNTVRFEKELRAAKEGNDPESGVFGSVYSSAKEEYGAITERILSERGAIPLREYAVLSRSNAELSRIAEVFGECGLPFYLKETVTLCYEEPEAKDIMAYLSFACEGRGRGDFLRIMNKPLRYLQRECVTSETVDFGKILAHYRDRPYMRGTIERFAGVTSQIAKMRPSLAIGYIVNAAGYGDHVRREYGAERYAKLSELVNRMKEDASPYSDFPSFRGYVEAYLERMRTELALASDIRRRKDSVRLVTMHSSKGLEFDTVFLPFLNEGILPARGAVTDAQTEEERRMLYVAMTRAKRRLFLSYQTGMQGKSRVPSRFLKPLHHVFTQEDT